jgi:5'-nucleotidase/UDP-sugar diphosphatase
MQAEFFSRKTFGRLILIVFLQAEPFAHPEKRFQENVTILYTNDLHGQYLPFPSERRFGTPHPQTGGMEALYDLVQRERNGHTLLFDGGDHETGTFLSYLPVEGVRGGGMIQMMNLLGINASVIGNHEFDSGWENLMRMMKMAEFDVLSANLFREGRLFAERAYRIYRVDGLRIGVIGLSTEDLYTLVFSLQLDNIQAERVIPVARKIVRMIDPETDLIVLLTHIGFKEDSLLAEAVPQADLIVGGHSHTEIHRPVKVNGVLIVQAGSRSEYLGRLDLTVQDDRVKAYSGRLIPVQKFGIPKRTKMTDLVSRYRNLIEKQYGQIIGELQTPWKTAQYQESNIGNYFADVMRGAADVDFAVINSGGIRKDLPAGPIRKLDVFEIFPFSNRLVRFFCTGWDLMRLIETNARASFLKSHGILQVSGLRYAARMNENKDVTISDAIVNGTPVQRGETYTGVTVDYVVPYNAGRYMGFKPSKLENLDVIVSDAVIEHIQKDPKVSSRIEGRMRHEKGE